MAHGETNVKQKKKTLRKVPLGFLPHPPHDLEMEYELIHEHSDKPLF